MDGNKVFRLSVKKPEDWIETKQDHDGKKKKKKEPPVDMTNMSCPEICAVELKEVEAMDLKNVAVRKNEMVKKYVYTAYLPGVKRSDLKLSKLRNTVTVEATRFRKLRKKYKCDCDFHTKKTLEKRKEVWKEIFTFDFKPDPKKVTVSLDGEQSFRLIVEKPADYIRT